MTYFRFWLATKLFNLGFKVMPTSPAKALLHQYLTAYSKQIYEGQPKE